ncbi:MAG: CPBP family intramembrane metalloprotease [Planctomycetaceae bacterium]|nr:CPBP family intramembrane metalloprotease [Planctomycetaceae bacterium]
MESRETPHPSVWLRLWSLVEIVLIVGLIEAYLWFLKGTSDKMTKNLVVVAIVALVGFSIWRLRDFRPQKAGWFSVWVKTVVGSLIMAGVMLLAAWGVGVINTAAYSDFWAKIIGDDSWFQRKMGTVVAQQIALQLCLLPACVQLTNRRWGGIALAATLFSLIHSPNPYLMLLTVFGAAFWCWVWLDSRRLVPLICSHLLLAVLAREYCNDALYNMRVGHSTLDLFPVEITTSSGESFVNDPMQFKGEWNVLRIDEDQVVCTGWVADVRRRELVDQLVVVADIEGRPRRIEFDGIPNDDVRNSYGPKIADSGFELSLPLDLFQQSVRLFAYRDGIGYGEVLAAEEVFRDQSRNPFHAARLEQQKKQDRLAKSQSSTQQPL